MSTVSSRHGNDDTKAQEAYRLQRKNRYYKDAGTSPSPSPQRTRTGPLIWRQPPPSDTKKMASVVYYLSRNGVLEQPHFIEVPLPSPVAGLHLRDVIARLNSLRGRGMADLYSWSSKRNYRGGYVWQDLSMDDLIHPCNDGQEYVLKGSQLLQLPSSGSSRSDDTTPSPASKNSSESPGRSHGSTYEARSTAEFVRNSTDASTQTDNDKRRTSFPSMFMEELRKAGAGVAASSSSSPPPASSSSNEGMEEGMKKGIYGVRDIRNQVLEGERPSGRMKAASSALMQLIMCVPKSGVEGVDNLNNVHV